jgi:SAM-dependent methyltransferase
MEAFYARTLQQLLDRQVLRRDMELLIVCGSDQDRDVLRHVGFTRATISNVEPGVTEDLVAPYTWSHQHAEALTFPDGAFDFVIVHEGLHHCHSPHRAMLEMYRVARRGILVFEPRDTLLVRLGVRLDFGQEYEVAAVAGNRLTSGGVDNTAIPNYVYRWSEREIEKTFRAFEPLAPPRICHFYTLRIPSGRIDAMKNRLAANLLRALLPLVRLLTRLFPKQCNGFAWVVEKPELPRDLHPWLELERGKPVFSAAWGQRHYGEFKRPDPSPSAGSPSPS